MWPVERFRRELPDPFELRENEDVVILRCRRCGETVPFSAAGTTAEEILRAARAHRCPDTDDAGRTGPGCGQSPASGEDSTHARRCPRRRPGSEGRS